MTVTTEAQRRVAYCQCGARLAGDSELELFEAAERHIAEHHQSLSQSGAGTRGGSPGADENAAGDDRHAGWGH
jgi:hypothetical protein